MSGVQLDALIRGCEVQARPCLALEEPEHVGAVADVIDPPVGRTIFDERLAGGAFHRPVDGPREQVHPVAGSPCRRRDVPRWLLASSPGRNKSSSSESRRHSSNIACISASRSGPGSWGWPSPWNSARWTISTPMSLNISTRSGVDPGLALGLLLHRRHGVAMCQWLVNV